MRYIGLITLFAVALVLRATTALGAGDPAQAVYVPSAQELKAAQLIIQQAQVQQALAAQALQTQVTTPAPQEAQAATPQPSNPPSVPKPAPVPAPAPAYPPAHNAVIQYEEPLIVKPSPTPVPHAEIAYNTDVAASGPVLIDHDHEPFHEGRRTMITPMVGGATYGGGWGSYVNNSISLGVAVNLPTSDYTAFEVEGDYAHYTRLYAMIGRGFDQWDLAGNFKLFFTRSTVRPWVGVGLMALDYSNMYFMDPYGRQTNSMIGAGQLLAGVDICLSDSISIGARGSWVVPLFNRPQTYDGAFTPMPGTQDASLINTSFYRLMAAVSIAL